MKVSIQRKKLRNATNLILAMTDSEIQVDSPQKKLGFIAQLLDKPEENENSSAESVTSFNISINWHRFFFEFATMSCF